MSPLYLYNNNLLVVANKLAEHQNCCCQPCNYCSGGTGGGNCYAWSSADIPTGCTGSKQPYPSCAGLIYFGFFTGSLPDRFIVRAGSRSGPIILDTGCVQHGESDWQTNPSGLVFGDYYACKPAGYTTIDIEWIPCGNRGGFAARIGNCLLSSC